MADDITPPRANTNGNNSPLPTPNLTAISSKLLSDKMESSRELQGETVEIVDIGNVSSPGVLSELTHEELVAQLMKAYAKIEELENTHHHIERLDGSDSAQAQTSEEFFEELNNSSNNRDRDGLWEQASHDVIQELQAKLKSHSNFADSFIFRPSIKNEEFVIAYEHKGDFPDCDEDLLFDALEEDSQSARIAIQDGMWDRDDESSSSDEFGSSADEIEDFPLIPSPILNTPPYEYIFLTKENEAKFRIFLNPKLNKVFQEEVSKLKAQNDRHKQLHVAPQLPHHHDQHFLDVHNQNHLINPSHSEMEPFHENTISASNVIHCFDPSDVDLELKKIFMEKPPITHKIVRRRTRKERGSSVPAVDSYYGTRDLNKVGHASYFIPILTESERKAIGWKPDYHYGHWKYSHFTVPNNRTNPISLHPHPHPVSDEHGKKGCISRHHHSYHHCRNQTHHHTRPLLSQNPLHQKEINLSEVVFLLGSEAQSLLDNPTSPAERSQSLKHARDADDPLSFITLSGSSSDPSQTSCHIIPDSCALKRILRWLLPSCMKPQEVNDKSSLISTCPNDRCEKGNELDNQNEVDEASKKANHEIETLVEPSSRLAFPASDTNVSFSSLEARDDRKEKANNNTVQANQAHSKNTSPEYKHHSEHHHNGNNNNHHHHNHHSHHHQNHHHGFFHWKHILNHGTSVKSEESMSVVGGDVVESGNASSTGGCGAIQLLNILQDDPRTEDVLGKDVTDSVHSSSSEDSDVGNIRDGTEMKQKHKRRNGKKLKSCRAFEKLLTLKDLGYESEEAEFELAHERIKFELEALERKEFETEEAEWTCPVVL